MGLRINNMLLAASVAACSPDAPGSSFEDAGVRDVPKQTVESVRAEMKEFCDWVPSDVDGIDCVLTVNGDPVASMYEACVSAKPSSDDSNLRLAEVDAMNVPDDCEIVTAQF